MIFRHLDFIDMQNFALCAWKHSWFDFTFKEKIQYKVLILTQMPYKVFATILQLPSVLQYWKH